MIITHIDIHCTINFLNFGNKTLDAVSINREEESYEEITGPINFEIG